MATHSPEDEVHVREHPFPGSGRLWTVSLAGGVQLAIAADADGTGRELAVTRPGDDEPVVSVELTGVESTTVAALLSGIRFVVRDDDAVPVNAANLRTVALPAGVWAVGRRLDELVGPEPDEARVIAVIRDDTPDLLEDDPERPCEPGDRLVLVGRPGSMKALVEHLLG